MNISLNNYEPIINLDIINQDRSIKEVKCLVDTWFTWVLACPYFLWVNSEKSIINQFDLFNPILLENNDWIETANSISKTYKASIILKFKWLKLESEILIYESKFEFSENKDLLILWMKFIELNNLDLHIAAKNWKFFISELK